ncbi:hypothetical protein [Deinococcus hopiensis]|uniref:Uncharacterized protein n=1 Tax=Deinococcus hopiensis KR-140 TaxID=695939 RepID=A0A1W1VSE0_9DEIO|nr:hypothetical protein [Deinococcus hopiensis]SMB96268.1 hypothetical protein SAMN00790413_03231 [Deinococcus hopiensis KR-140]
MVLLTTAPGGVIALAPPDIFVIGSFRLLKLLSHVLVLSLLIAIASFLPLAVAASCLGVLRAGLPKAGDSEVRSAAGEQRKLSAPAPFGRIPVHQP